MKQVRWNEFYYFKSKQTITEAVLDLVGNEVSEV